MLSSRLAALYLRVSTRDQTTENQELALQQWAERLDLDVVKVYADTASGARGDRAALADLFADAQRGRFSVLLLWSLDRLTREGPVRTLVFRTHGYRADGTPTSQDRW